MNDVSPIIIDHVCEELMCGLFFQFPGGSDNYMTITGTNHPFLSSTVGMPEFHNDILCFYFFLFPENPLCMETEILRKSLNVV